MSRRKWSDQERQVMRECYPKTPTREVAERLGRSERSVYTCAAAMGLHKSQEYLSSPESGRLRKGVRSSPGTEFRKGQTPFNKGRKMPKEVYAKCAPTMFKKGEMRGAAQHNYRPIGSLRVTKDGQLEKKVTDDPSIYPSRRWVPVSRLVWEQENGPVPDGHIVRFRAGMGTVIEEEITLDKLECISRVANMKRNSVHNLPAPIPQLVQLRGALNRKIRNRQRMTNEKQAG